MPVRRSSSNGGSFKLSRKPRVAVGSSKGTGDGFRNPRSKDSDAGKGQRKVKFLMDDSKGSSSGVRAGEGKKWSRNSQSRENGRDAAPYFNGNGKSSDMRGRGRRDSEMKGGREGRDTVIDGKLGWKRKRTSAETGTGDQAMFGGDDKKSRSEWKKNALNSFLDNDKKPSRRKDNEFKNSSRGKLVTERGKFRGSESLDKRSRNGKIGGVDKPKFVTVGNSSKMHDRSKAPLATQKELNQRENVVGGSVAKPLIKRVQRNKLLVTDSDLAGERPKKKKKRGIRIDPYDTSNKRLDDRLDSISDKGTDQVKIDKTGSSDIEMSKNAQFRAICPSPSILSFVDDNLLGRRREIEFKRAGYNIELPAPLDNIPFSTLSERERIEVPAFRNKLEFFAAAKVSSSFPPPELPEIAFAGRSNVGKSSLLNALTRQWGVVRTSDKPGLTQTINFFKLGPKLCMVDLPGYGFAYAKEEVKEAWEELVKEYVMTRVGLKRVCLLVDTKWGMKPRDLELIDLMERYETKYQIVLTKTDLVFPIDVARRAMQIEENLKKKKSAVQPLMMISSRTGAGIRSLRTVLANVARLVK